MLKAICLCLLTCLVLIGFAQNQQGYVKTKGRMVNGKYYAGKPINGATIRVRGRASVLSRQDGTFSLAIAGKGFNLQQVQKQGYVLLDQDMLYRQYVYSSNPLEVVMEDKAQLEADRRALERQVRRMTDEELRRRGEEIEALKEQNKISEDRYREMLNKLNNDYDQNEQLIKDMVDRYNKIDFDQLDEFNRHVSDCIINGRLDEADSLLRTKGDIEELIDHHQKLHESNIQAKASLKKSEAAEHQDLMQIAKICEHRFNYFKVQHKNDSATYYILKRAELDTLNIEWTIDAGYFILEYTGAYDKSLEQYARALRHSDIKQQICEIQNRLGTLFFLKGDLDSALHFFEAALETEITFGLVQTVEAASTHDNIGVIYDWKSDFNKALEYHWKAISILTDIKISDSSAIATAYNNLAVSFEELGHLDSAFYYYHKALSIREKHLGLEQHETATSYNNVGYMYMLKHNEDSALVYFLKALAINERTLSPNHPSLANIYNNLGACERARKNYSASIEYHHKALAIQEKILGGNHFQTAGTYNNIGAVYEDTKQYDKSLAYYLKALEAIENLFGHDNRNTAIVINNIGSLYGKINDCENAIKYCMEAITILEKTIDGNHISKARSYHKLGSIYFDCKNYPMAIEWFQKALPVYISTYGEENELTTDLKSQINNATKELDK